MKKKIFLRLKHMFRMCGKFDMILTTIEKYHTPTVIGYNLRRKNFKPQKLSHQNEIKSNLMAHI